MPTAKKTTVKKAPKEKIITPDQAVAADSKDTTPKVVAPKRQTFKTFNEAFFAFQGMNLVIPRNGKGNINGKDYAYPTLDDTLIIVIPALQSVGLMLMQPIYGDRLRTSIVHVASGEKIESDIPTGTPEKTQDLGARITYLRRYQILSMLGLSLGEDVDAKGVNGGKTTSGFVQASQTVDKSQDVAKEPSADVAAGAVVPQDESPKVGASEAFMKASNAIDSCMGLEALALIRANIGKSTRLTDAEKEVLIVVLEGKEAKLSQ